MAECPTQVERLSHAVRYFTAPLKMTDPELDGLRDDDYAGVLGFGCNVWLSAAAALGAGFFLDSDSSSASFSV